MLRSPGSSEPARSSHWSEITEHRSASAIETPPASLEYARTALAEATEPRPTLLLACSDPALRGLIAQRQTAAGHCVIEASCAARAAELFRTRGPASVIVSSNLDGPGRGIELTHEIGALATTRRAPIVLLLADDCELGDRSRLAPVVHAMHTVEFRSKRVLSRAVDNLHEAAHQRVRALPGRIIELEFAQLANTQRSRSERMASEQVTRAIAVLGSVLDKVGRDQLPGPVMPEMLERVQALLARPEVDLRTLSRFAERHQALAGRLLSVANSALFARGSAIVAVDKAVARLGADETTALMRAVAALAFVTGKHGGLRRLIAENLRMGYFVGVVARMLAGCEPELKSRERMSEVYTLGLFHNIGSTYLYYAAALLHDDGQLEEIDCTAFRTVGRGRAEQLNKLVVSHMGMSKMIEAVHQTQDERLDDPQLRCVLRAMWIADQVVQSDCDRLSASSKSEQLGLDSAAIDDINARIPALRDAMAAYLPSVD